MRTNAKLAMAAAILVAALAFQEVQAQVRIGLQFCPGVSFNRVADKTSLNDATRYANTGASPTFSAGAYMDWFFRSNYALFLGLRYTVKREAFEATGNTGSGTLNFNGTSIYNLQMAQIPVGIKLFTNEVVPDWKLFFLLAGSPDIVFAQKARKFSSDQFQEPEHNLYKPLDISMWFSSGVEYRVAESTTLTGGITYNRGLVNLVTKTGAFGEGSDAKKRYTSKTDLITLDIGVKF